jgi:hypothetical protein
MQLQVCEGICLEICSKLIKGTAVKRKSYHWNEPSQAMIGIVVIGAVSFEQALSSKI